MDKSFNDLYLFEKVKLGDQKSFDLLFQKYYNNLCNYAYLFLKENALTQEIVADVYLKIWNNKQNIEIKTNLKSYFFRSTHNEVISYLRKSKLQTVSLDQNNDMDHIFEESPETLLINKETCITFSNMINELPKQAGLVFRLHKVDGLTYKQISEVLELSIKTVENHMGRALKIIRKMCDSKPDFFKD